MPTDFSQFIVPICSNSFGVGFLAGDLFITAAHVVSDHPVNVTICGKQYRLSRENALFFRQEELKNEYSMDLAVWQLSGVESPLRLSNRIPAEGLALKAYTVVHEVTAPVSTGRSIFCHLPLERFRNMEVEGYRTGCILGRYFNAHMNGLLQEGSSGSPIIYGDEVMGVLIGCLNPRLAPEKILFLRTDEILDVVEKSRLLPSA